MSEACLAGAETVDRGISEPSAVAASALRDTLALQSRFVDGLTDEQYTVPPAPGLSSIGGHVRHTLDHIRALLNGAPQGVVDYDRRARGTDVERHRHAGIAETDRLIDECEQLARFHADESMRVRARFRSDLPPVSVASTVHREVLFVLSHTIHHHAMMVSAARTLGAPSPPLFGYAPATIAFLNETATSG